MFDDAGQVEDHAIAPADQEELEVHHNRPFSDDCDWERGVDSNAGLCQKTGPDSRGKGTVGQIGGDDSRHLGIPRRRERLYGVILPGILPEDGRDGGGRVVVGAGNDC